MSSNSLPFFVVHRNGRAAAAADLAPLAFAGHAHFTAMQVRHGCVRGLDLHLERVRSSSILLYGRSLADDHVRSCLRSALQASPPDHSLVATVYSPSGEFTAGRMDEPLDILIRTAPAASGPAGPLSLCTVEYERVLPGIKHVGEVAKTHYLRQAVAQGFDDAAFLDRRGRLSEASIWNLAFWDGHAVVWPRAEMLEGVTMGILRRQLQRLEVPQREQEITLADLPALRGAVVMNSWTPAVAVHRIGNTALPHAPAFIELLHQAYQAEAFGAP